MKCKQVKYKLSEYLDGRLGEKETSRVVKHLERCSSCRESYEDLKNYQHLVSNLDPQKAPKDLEENVLERIHKGEPTIAHRDKVIPLWAKTIAAAAIILGFIYLVLPDQYFSPAVVETEYIQMVEKRGKGDKKGAVIDDPRAQFIEELATTYKGEILKTDANKTNALIEGISLQVPKKSYPAFVNDYNRSNPFNLLSGSLPFTLSKNVQINIYLGTHAYAVKDFNNDGFGDILMCGLAGRNRNHAVVAYNNKEGLFGHPVTIILPDDVDPISKSRNRFEADIDGDGYDEIVERIGSGEHPEWIYYQDSTLSEKTIISFEAHASGYFGEYMIFFGDFDGDGFDDILAKNGSSIREGEWYISLNNRENGFKLGYELRFGESRYFVFEYALFD